MEFRRLNIDIIAICKARQAYLRKVLPKIFMCSWRQEVRSLILSSGTMSYEEDHGNVDEYGRIWKDGVVTNEPYQFRFEKCTVCMRDIHKPGRRTDILKCMWSNLFWVRCILKVRE